MYEQLQRHIPYRFTEVKLLRTALTHSSHANEEQGSRDHNERLEFLGDAVLELCISEELFLDCPEAREGELTAKRSALVNQENLAAAARRIGLDRYLVLGKGEEAQGGRNRDSLLSDALEALIGAVFLDGGYAAARQAVRGLFAADAAAGKKTTGGKDGKSRLQEASQRLFKERPVYSLVDSKGPEHDKVFKVRLRLPDGRTFSARGSSVKKAEQAAALLALEAVEVPEFTEASPRCAT
ncbi:MAG: ribonuclease III [Desulfovibrio sp.]|jgi:ribonuclease-3|nr:ribonuclease III [Desulfovibrio sp.]